MQAATLLNDRYELVKPLASGGMAHVWLGRDRILGRTVAVKILREEYTGKPDFQERFLQEAQAIAKLSHPNLVTVYDFGIQNGQYFMVMEYVEGEDLKSFLRRAPGHAFGAGNPQPVDLWLDIAIQVCEGLGLAHRAGLVHCDIKPQNILLSGELIAKIADFGIARALGRSAGGESNPGASEEDVVWGSPQYLSPEQAAGEALTPASDMYSTGVMLFEMLTGRLPFPGKDPRTLALQHRFEPAPSVRLLNPGLPPELDEIVLRALSKDPLQRYRNGEQMARVLKVFLKQHGEFLAQGASVENEAEEEEAGIDWKAVGLGFVDLIVVGSLIPLWVYVFFLYNPPGK
jgi:serine/threonine-protein kinase